MLPVGTFQRHVNVYEPNAETRDDSIRFPEHPPLLIWQHPTSTGSPQLTHIGFRVDLGLQQNAASTSANAAESSGRSRDGHPAMAVELTSSGSLAAPESDSDDNPPLALPTWHVLVVTRKEHQQAHSEPLVSVPTQRLVVYLSVVDFIMVLYSILSSESAKNFSIGVLVGLVISNALFVAASRTPNTWFHTIVVALLPINAGVLFTINTPEVLVARLLVVLAEVAVIVWIRSHYDPAVYFL